MYIDVLIGQEPAQRFLHGIGRVGPEAAQNQGEGALSNSRLQCTRLHLGFQVTWTAEDFEEGRPYKAGILSAPARKVFLEVHGRGEAGEAKWQEFRSMMIATLASPEKRRRRFQPAIAGRASPS
jgi:hypothetical protein